MELYQLIAPLGIATYLSLVVTILLGHFRNKLPVKFWMKWHMVFAFSALILGTVHFILVLIYH